MQKIKHFIESDKGKDILVVIIVILVGVISFFLGRLSYTNPQKGLKIEYTDQEASVVSSFENPESNLKLTPSIENRANNEGSGKYFASKMGHKYYPTGCSAGKTIKQENRIYFSSASEAEKAGFTLSASCQ
ncbi:MAG TPA: hypothetical protein PKZ36_03345 [Candidatus Paceibacterota bacterium]|nr:hypothetical protein [Candidatus Paceibacterota bacterium]HPT18412.1 hypothetical protein [Candidatus Paceibacterota bacterium]